MNTPDNANVLGCISMCGHHADYTKFHPPLDVDGRRRMRKIEDGLKKIRIRVKKIYDLAERNNDTEIKEILDEVFEFGPEA